MIKYSLIIVALLALTSALLIPTTTIEINKAEPISIVDITSEITNTYTEADTTKISNGEKEIPEEIIYESSVGEVIFLHQLHYEDEEIECVECHHEMNAKNINIPHEEYFDEFWIDCAACHDREEEGEMVAHACSDCHNSNPVNIADEMISRKVAIHENCWGCHETGTSLEASESCSTCHTKEEN